MNIAVSKGLEAHNMDLVQSCERLKSLMGQEWEEEVTINSHNTLYEQKRNISKGLLPLTNDVKLLVDYINRESDLYYNILNKSNSDTELLKSAWLQLSELTLASTIVFNRRRAGEVSKMQVA